MEQLTALQLFETGLKKSEIKTMAKTAVDNVLENGGVLIVAEALAAMENFVKEVRHDPRFEDFVREEARKTPKGYISNSGAKIELAEFGTKYDYSQTGDVELQTLEFNFLCVENDLKERKEFLKTVPASGLVVTNEETGETYKIYPPTKTSISSYKVTLAK